MLVDKDKIFEIFRFGVVGILATAIHYGIYYGLKSVIWLQLAYTLGYAISFCANYILSNRFTFRTQPTLKNGVGFGAAHLFNYLLQMSLLQGWLYVGVADNFAPFLVFGITIPINYLVVRYVLISKRKTLTN